MTKRARWSILLLGLLFGALALAQPAVLTGVVVVTEVNGRVQVRIGNDPPRRLQAGRRVPVGAVVMTGADGNVVLTFADGQMVVLGERSALRIVNFQFDRKELGRSGVVLNLIDGSARLVLGAIGEFDPRLIRVQVGTGILTGTANLGDRTAKTGIELEGATSMVTVTQGQVALTLPSGQGIVMTSGQGVYVQPNGAIQQGSVEQVLTQIVQTPGGKQIVEQMESMQSFELPQRNRRTVITLAAPQAALSPDQATLASAAIEALPPPGETNLATTTPITAPTGGGGGGTPCGASCN
jgi:hypothetical protein